MSERSIDFFPGNSPTIEFDCVDEPASGPSKPKDLTGLTLACYVMDAFDGAVLATYSPAILGSPMAGRVAVNFLAAHLADGRVYHLDVIESGEPTTYAFGVLNDVTK